MSAAPDHTFDHSSRRRAAIAGSLGNLIEWYDFYTYAYLALYFASTFFPSGDRTAQLLNIAAIYAAGFLIRPIGGWYFGRYADRHGRRAAMVLSVLLMGAGSLVIALLPGYETVGVAAPALLLIARLMQGFSSGGQYGAAAAYLSEIGRPGRRGLVASMQFVTLIGGQLGALLVLQFLHLTLGEEAIREWAWRLPFALGAVLAAGIVMIRHLMIEMVDPQEVSSGAGTLHALREHPRSFFAVMAISAGGAVCLYSFTTYMQKYLVNTAGLAVSTASQVMLAATVGFLLLQPLIGALSDRIGRRTCLLIFSGGMTLGAVPLLGGLARVGGATEAFLLVFAALLVMSFYTSISGLFKAELFPAKIRALGIGLAHAIASAIFGGTAEWVALALKQQGHEHWFGWYVASICAVSFLTALALREPRRLGHLS